MDKPEQSMVGQPGNNRVGDSTAGDQKTIEVLAIEDNPADAYMVEMALQRLTRVPFNVTTIDNMPDAEIALRETKCDVILLDLNVGESRGWETFDRVNKIVQGRIPIVISTGLEDDGMAIRAIQAGAQDYYVKETTKIPGILSRILRYAIQRHEDKQQLHRINNILHRREAELEETLIDLKHAQLSLVEAEKMKTIGRLAAGVAHEVKNPLQIIKMGVNFVGGRLPEEDMGHQVIDDINTAVERATDIIGGLLDFGAPKIVERDNCNVKELIEEAVSSLQNSPEQGEIACTIDIKEPLKQADIDRHKILEVLVNLITNAYHAMEENGGDRLNITASIVPLSEVRHITKVDQKNIGTNSADAVLIEIQDSGPGIAEEVLPKLFEPFFTTKIAKKSTGLGLCVCRQIMELHEGGLSVTNTESGGAVARVYWPLNAS